jgi:ABC-type sugar transport system ATPase subunit
MSDIGLALQLEQVSKRYTGMLAVDGVDFDVRAGEVHALIGENGAGKSTLMNIIAGAFADYTGRILIGGQEVALHSPVAAKRHGIQMIHQELSLARTLSVAENLLAGRLPARHGILDRRALRTEARALLKRVGLDSLDPATLVEDIGQHEAQLVEIAKALGNRPCILVMDEPTSALSRDEVKHLFEIVRNLRRQGLAIVYISHHLPEILEIADRVSVMRDGKKIATREMCDVTQADLVEMMVGRAAASDLYSRKARSAPGKEKLQVRGLTRTGVFHDVSFSVRCGEILGIGGLAGSGRTELARALVAADAPDAGELLLDGRPIRPKRLSDAIRLGMAYLPEDRKSLGLALRLSSGENLLAALIPRLTRRCHYSARRGAGTLGRLMGLLQVHPSDPQVTVRNLSGGNQQKVLLAKWLAVEPHVLILDEPTRGVDIGAKVIIHRAIEDVAEQGRAVILISSDLPELVSLSDRVLILRHGRMIREMPRESLSEESVLLAANGGVGDA